MIEIPRRTHQSLQEGISQNSVSSGFLSPWQLPLPLAGYQVREYSKYIMHLTGRVRNPWPHVTLQGPHSSTSYLDTNQSHIQSPDIAEEERAL